MSTIKINELASSAISLTDFFAKADASGVANKNTIQGLSNFLNTVGTLAFKGVLLAADAAVTQDGIYVAGDAGTYTNNGGLVITLGNKVVLISITGTQTVFEKVEFPLSITIDATVVDGSANAVQGNAVFDALALKVNTSTQATTENIVGSTKYFDGAKTVTKLKAEVSTANVDDTDQTKFATAAMVKAEQIAGIAADEVLNNKIGVNSVNLIGTETNFLKSVTTVIGRTFDSGAITDDANWFRTLAFPVVAGERYSSNSSVGSGTTPRFAFYSSADTVPANLVGSVILARDVVVPATATYMIFAGDIIIEDGYILQKLASPLFPVFGSVTFVYNSLYKKEELYRKDEIDAIILPINNKVTANETSVKNKIDTSLIGLQTNLLKLATTSTVDGFRTSNLGADLADATYFRTNSFAIDKTKRIAVSSSNNGTLPRFAFYNSSVLSAANFLGIISNSREVTVANYPAGTTHLVFAGNLSNKDTYVLQYISDANTFPRLDLETFNYSKVATKDEVTKRTLKEDFKTELNYFKKPNAIIQDGFRQNDAGDIIADATTFLIREIDVEAGDRFSTVSDDPAQFPKFTFYSSSTVFDSTTLIGTFTLALSATAPSGVKKMFISQKTSLKSSFILQKLSGTLFPILGANTSTFKSNEITPEFYGTETNILKQAKSEVLLKKRANNGGVIIADSNTFMLNLYPVVVGKRYAVVSNTGNPVYTGRFGFYPAKSDANIIGGATLDANEATAPAGAKYMIFSGDLATQSTFILKQLDAGFPELEERTVELNDTYDKEHLDTNFSKDKWYPDVFSLDVTYTQRSERILAIKNDVLYGSDGFRKIIKTSQTDLSDINYQTGQGVVCTLNTENSRLTNLLFISDIKAVGYVQNPITTSAEGFYVFENTDTNTWSQRKTGVMISGFPDGKFQNLIRCSTNGYLFACSYSLPSGKNNPPSNPVNPAPVNVYRSIDEGETWQIVYTHPNTLNTHMHAVEFDKFRDRVWAVIGDENDGGTPGWIWSDDYGDTWDFVANNDEIGQIPFMDTAILPTRKYVLFGSDFTPAGIRKWQPPIDGKNEVVENKDVTNAYLIPVKTTNNFGFARKPAIDTSSYPYKIVLPVSHNESYSKACFLLSPNYRDWYMLNLENDPANVPSVEGISGITSNGTVIGWCVLTGVAYYFTFNYPNWIKN